MKFHGKRNTDEVKLELTSMIDIIFLLLAFFVMTFKIVAPEGDFNVRMPTSAPSQGQPDPDAHKIAIYLNADTNGNLTNIRFEKRPIGTSFQQLRAEMQKFIGKDATPASLSLISVEIDFDDNIKYENIIAAITAVSGSKTTEGRIVRMIENVNIAP